MWFLRSCLLAFGSAFLLSGVAGAQASVRSTVSPVPAFAAAAATGEVGISIGSGAIQSLGPVTDNTTNSFPNPVSITLTWDLHPSTASVQVIGYFTSASAAMTSGPVSIPASWIKGRVLTAGVNGAPTTYTAFTQNATGGVGSAGGSLTLASQPVLGYSKAGTLTFDLQLQLDLTGRELTAGSYSGTLNIRAVTQ
jgi:hypothetical protein